MDLFSILIFIYISGIQRYRKHSILSTWSKKSRKNKTNLVLDLWYISPVCGEVHHKSLLEYRSENE